jgi:putative hydrolase of the HAD superfamily
MRTVSLDLRVGCVEYRPPDVHNNPNEPTFVAGWAQHPMTIRSVMFDVAGVLTAPFSMELVADVLDAGADPDVLFNVLYPIFASAGDGQSAGNRLERGELTLEAFFESLGDDARHVRPLLDPGSATFFGDRWARNDSMQAFVHEVAAAGFHTALVSNIVQEWMPTWERVVPTSLPFDARIYSCVEGTRKPEAAIFEVALARLGVAAGEALFLDDFEVMTQGARRAGMHAVHVVDTDAAIAEARSLLGI